MASLASLYNGDSSVENMSEYINDFIARRFPDADNLPADFRAMIADIVFDAFADGALYAENANGLGVKRIIRPA